MPTLCHIVVLQKSYKTVLDFKNFTGKYARIRMPFFVPGIFTGKFEKTQLLPQERRRNNQTAKESLRSWGKLPKEDML